MKTLLTCLCIFTVASLIFSRISLSFLNPPAASSSDDVKSELTSELLVEEGMTGGSGVGGVGGRTGSPLRYTAGGSMTTPTALTVRFFCEPCAAPFFGGPGLLSIFLDVVGFSCAFEEPLISLLGFFRFAISFLAMPSSFSFVCF